MERRCGKIYGNRERAEVPIMKKNQKKPSTFKLILKICLVLFLAFNWLNVALFLVMDYYEESTDYLNTDAARVNRYDEYYYEKQYDELFDELHLYDNYEEIYDVYWEVLDAYIASKECLKWKNVSDSEIEDAREMEQYYLDKVKDAAKNCRFPQNQKYLNDFVESVQ